jgi:hypothetical protein
MSCQAFKSGPDNEKFPKLRDRNTGYSNPALRNDNDQALGFQPSQCRTDRHGADPHGLGNLSGGKEFLRTEATMDDVEAQLLMHQFAQGLARAKAGKNLPQHLCLSGLGLI